MSANWAALEQAIKAAGIAALNRTASKVEERARQLAPIRNIFEGAERRVRFKTMQEVKADRVLRRRLNLGREYIAAPRTRLKSRKGRLAALVAVGGTNVENDNVPVFRIRNEQGLVSPLATMRLHGRGRYEVESRRADYEGRVGGRLRGEIAALGATGEGSVFEARVISPTPYAKYQEFGTRHNAAQPYLRPALREMRPELLALMRDSIRGAIRGNEIEVVVELSGTEG